jgi:hypothetical protein
MITHIYNINLNYHLSNIIILIISLSQQFVKNVNNINEL